ncbi:NADH-ubiquinone oxidoreductase chain K [Dissulfuribacter thermophilus]|uniref:NADH-quinone oxidoreductase subunit K n=1 Tax=Dissulfuribacter thermophilus TaxID=1156395 RepID=A0A1B9F475_9BACT|nr:NADH-quinone oxidoreductase subunit NuoK [Dissulfuribacter thermophilus]OCC14615.1 NADH-ubiquinone oxidoreductase chain K [Dissulfuribacter thermophilus]
MAGLTEYIILASVLFGIGAIGFLTRRNALILFMCVEMMLNSVNLMLVAFSHFRADMAGQVMVLFIYAVAAAEVAVGLAILIALFRHVKDVDITKFHLLRW